MFERPSNRYLPHIEVLVEAGARAFANSVDLLRKEFGRAQGRLASIGAFRRVGLSIDTPAPSYSARGRRFVAGEEEGDAQ
jgi:hypothetical protein